MKQQISIILPAFNEEPATLVQLIDKITECAKGLGNVPEIIIVDDGSDPPVSDHSPAQVVRHPYNMGNGAAIKSGARKAKGEILVFLDADGQHDPNDIPQLLKTLEQGYDMVVGARTVSAHASFYRRLGNGLYNKLASIMTGYKIKDLTSGFRTVRTEKFKKFLYLLPNGFSYPTTITMAFFRSGYAVSYVPVKTEQREGVSKIKVFKDGVRFFVIILKVGTLFSPMRLFLPVSFMFFMLGLIHYAYTFFTFGRFTNMSALLFIAAMLTFLIGVVSEQVSSLHYKNTEEK